MTEQVVSVDLLEAFRRSDDAPKEWTEAQTRTSLERYQRFLGLVARHPRERVAPTRDIDIFWHLHMLHPKAYYEDCQRLFGRILDHDGGFGKGDGELPILKTVFAKTEKLWQEAYGEPYVSPTEHPEGDPTNCWHNCESRCWHACSGE